MKTIGLVSCVKTKRAEPSAAKDLYQSPLFKRMRRYAEGNCDEWLILSAKYGVLQPESVIAPYELTLNALPISERMQWAEMAWRQLARILPSKAHIIILAGARYRTLLLPQLSSTDFTIEIPMEGLRMGEQMKWLNEHLPMGRD